MFSTLERKEIEKKESNLSFHIFFYFITHSGVVMCVPLSRVFSPIDGIMFSIINEKLFIQSLLTFIINYIFKINLNITNFH